MLGTMTIVRVSELYRQLGIDPVAAQRSGVSGLLPTAPPRVGGPFLPSISNVTRAGRLSGATIRPDADLGRNS